MTKDVNKFIILILTISCFYPSILNSQTNQTSNDLFTKCGEFIETIAPDSSSSIIHLTHRYIDPKTVVIIDEKEDTLHLEIDFTIDPTRGIITFIRMPPPKQIIVHYRYLPFTLPDSVVHHTLESIDLKEIQEGESGLEQVERRQMLSSLFNNKNLESSGHIFRGVQVGNQRDLSVESGLRLSLNGELAKNIEVKALLDDRKLPLQPEGTSRRLEEIDKVFVDIRSGRYLGRFGDYTLDFTGGRYGTFSRSLEGGIIERKGADLQLTAAGAVTRAVFHRNRFQGRDGVQGPYELTGRNGETNFSVIGGSEKVWVDGIERFRGQNSDYTIDYLRGAITFTPHLPITSESRIEVDFEYSPQAYPRNLYASRAATSNASQSFHAVATYIEEGDDYDRPISFDMTPEIRSSLGEYGIQSGLAGIPSADSLGPGKGDYTKLDTLLVVDNQLYSYFKFLPPQDGILQGEWEVFFSEVGRGIGEYERVYEPTLGAYSFRWVGPGNGSWSPVRQVPLPQRQRQGTLTLDVSPLETVRFAADLAGSMKDENVLSIHPNHAKTGVAQMYTVSFLLPAQAGNSFKRAEVCSDEMESLRSPLTPHSSPVTVTIHYRHDDSQFRPFARDREVEYERRWGIDTLTSGVMEEEYGAEMTVNPLQSLTLNSSYGKLERGADFSSERLEGGGEIQVHQLRSNIQVEQVESEDCKSSMHSSWLRGQAMGSMRLGVWIPSIEDEYEKRDQSIRDSLYSGYTYNRIRGAWSLENWKDHSGVISYENRQRECQVQQEQYEHLYDENAVGLTWNWFPRTLPWRSTIELSRRKKTFTVSDSSSITSNLASLQAKWTPYGGALEAELAYRLNQTVSKEQTLIAYQVPVGEGSYVRIGDEYIYDPELGDYILRSEPTGEARPTTELNTAFNLDWSPHRLPNNRGKIEGFGWEDISLVTQLELSEITALRHPSDIFLLNIKTFQSDSTLDGRMFLRQEWHLFRISRLFNLRLKYEAEKRMTAMQYTGKERFGSDAWSLRTRNAIGAKWDVEANQSMTRKYKQFPNHGEQADFLLLRASIQPSYRLSTAWNLSVKLQVLRDRQRDQAIEADGLSLEPVVTYALREHGRVTANFEALWVKSDAASIPYDLADSRPKGRNGKGGIRVDYRLGDHFTTRAMYSVRLDEGRIPMSMARVELQAYF